MGNKEQIKEVTGMDKIPWYILLFIRAMEKKVMGKRNCKCKDMKFEEIRVLYITKEKCRQK